MSWLSSEGYFRSKVHSEVQYINQVTKSVLD